jgi:transcriptional regulator with XRE-family HTH domain
MRENTERSLEEIAASIRAIRKQRGMTLKDVELASNGIWKAVVVGSYERCDRALSLKKAIALAHFYQVPLDQLLGLETSGLAPSVKRMTIDLRRVLASNDSQPIINILQTFLTLICAKRRDWNGEVLSLRAGDIENLSLVSNMKEEELVNWLITNSYAITR